MTTIERIIIEVDTLPDDEKRLLKEHLDSALLQPQPFMSRQEWYDFIDATSGILADDPIERPEQLPLEVRDEIE